MTKKTDFIDLDDYRYPLPKDRIAKAPPADRTGSKLLHYHHGRITHHAFTDMVDRVPADAHLVFNDTRVIPARLHFVKETGALIELFLLEPVAPTAEISQAMLAKNRCRWRCMVGNLKKWKANSLLTKTLADGTYLSAAVIDREKQLIEFTWSGDREFVHVLSAIGKTPLPPYIDRDVTAEDAERYQTVYSRFEGAVAAPTAGLHFDRAILDQLKSEGKLIDYLTLHVSAGTFKPVKTPNAVDHDMHSEQITVSKKVVKNLLEGRFTLAVGTTSMRTLESLYWFGVKLLAGDTTFRIEKLFPYASADPPPAEKALSAVIRHMEDEKLETITGTTEIFLFPGYSFRICNGLVTNFHLPASTLMLLVAAFVGEDWKAIYREAMEHNYRFLSYGDASLLMPKGKA